MAEDRIIKADSFTGQILVGVIVALLVGSVPWWWDKVSPPKAAEKTTNDGLDNSQTLPDTASTLDDKPGNQLTPVCSLTISNPLVALRNEPRRFSPEIGQVAPGEYSTLEHRTGTFAGQEEDWFRIEVQGRKGWIPDNTVTVTSKTETCP